jgi:DNA-binding MarR family transcriptional regulator
MLPSMAQQDSVDRHIEHWIKEVPDFDPVTEGVITRMQLLLKHLQQAKQATLAAHDLEPHEFGTLHMLGGCGPDHRATPGEIATWLHMSPSGITGRLDALERRGFIRRLPSPGDRRKVIVELTEEGRRAWLGALTEEGAEETRLLAALDPSERAYLSGLLRRMLLVIDRPGLLTPPASTQAPARPPKDGGSPRFTADAREADDKEPRPTSS